MKQHFITILSVVGFILLSCGCERSSSPSNEEFRLEVQEVTNGSDNRAALLLIHTKIPGSISVDGATKHSSVMLQETDSSYYGSVALLATRIAPGGNSKVYIQVLSRAQTSNGSFAGGPSVYPLPSTTRLEDVFTITAVSGEYPLNTPVEIAQEHGKPVTLTVGKPTK